MKTTDDEKIRKLYKYRCVVCRKLGNHVHEIVPRSLEKDWDSPMNRVVLCATCHSSVHAAGAMNYRPILEKKQQEVLLAYYGDNYPERITGLLA